MGELQFDATIQTPSNVIDLALLRNQSSVVYSMDTFHQPFSTDASADIGKLNPPLGSLSYVTESRTWQVIEALQANLVTATRECAERNLRAPGIGTANGKSLTELLYGLESLRKRGSENETDV